MKQILLLLFILGSVFVLGSAVYASPLNQKVNTGLQSFIDSSFGKEENKQDSCLLEKEESKEPKENCIH